jgi:hypothetical protein
MPMLLTNIDDPNDVERSIAILNSHRGTKPQLSLVASDNEMAEQLVKKLWPRLGDNLKALLNTVASKEKGSVHTIKSLANELGIEYGALRAKMNGPLRRSWKSVAKEIPDAPKLFQWESRGDHWEFTMTPAVRKAIRAQKS